MTRMTIRRRGASLLMLAAIMMSTVANGQDVVVLGGVDQAMNWLQSENWWGEENRDEQLTVPHAMITGINPRWRTTSQKLPVSQKKEIFYRFMLPLILHANGMVLERRDRLFRMKAALEELRRAIGAETDRAGSQPLVILDACQCIANSRTVSGQRIRFKF